jgi:hypothetical protein
LDVNPATRNAHVADLAALFENLLHTRSVGGAGEEDELAEVIGAALGIHAGPHRDILHTVVVEVRSRKNPKRVGETISRYSLAYVSPFG